MPLQSIILDSQNAQKLLIARVLREAVQLRGGNERSAERRGGSPSDALEGTRDRGGSRLARAIALSNPSDRRDDRYRFRASGEV